MAVSLKGRIRDSQEPAALRRRRSYLWRFRPESTTDYRGTAHCRDPTPTPHFLGSARPARRNLEIWPADWATRL